jgi:hypothetical protein
VSHTFTYRIDVSEADGWRTVAANDDTVIDERTASDLARALLEDWVVDNPGIGGRIVVYGYNASDLPPDDHDQPVRVRVSVLPGVEELDDDSAAVAYLLANPDAADPHGWVNP